MEEALALLHDQLICLRNAEKDLKERLAQLPLAVACSKAKEIQEIITLIDKIS
jgi:hypothetical protein